MLASNADTHRTPGAIRRSISRSGPIPKGNRLTTTTKKKRGISASDLRSKATSKSRRITTNTGWATRGRSEEHTSELQSLMRISYAVFCLKKKKTQIKKKKMHKYIKQKKNKNKNQSQEITKIE